MPKRFCVEKYVEIFENQHLYRRSFAVENKVFNISLNESYDICRFMSKDSPDFMNTMLIVKT